MARFYGEIGFGKDAEDPPGSGVWKQQVTEVPYFGDIVKNVRRISDGENLAANLSLNHVVSIIADDYAIQQLSFIKYVRWAGAVWEVTKVESQRPRLTLTLGGVYNGPTN